VRLIRAVIDALTPTPGTTEGAVMAGLLLLVAGFVVAGLPQLALIIPGSVLVVLGGLPALRRH
jgi:hypothetical protein